VGGVRERRGRRERRERRGRRGEPGSAGSVGFAIDEPCREAVFILAADMTL